MIVLHTIAMGLGIMIFAMPIMFPNSEIKDHHRGE